jgi:hypothetical protein
MRSNTPNPLTLEEHRELGCELRKTRARLHELSAMVSTIYGPNNRAAFSFEKAAAAMDRLCSDMDAQVAHDLPGYGTNGFYV